MSKKSLIVFLIFIVICVFSVLVLDKVFVLITPVEVVNYLESEDISLRSSLTINFSKPIKRQEAQISISPEVHGEWVFSDSLIENHLFKTLTFVPAVNFEQNTQYQVKIENIRGFGLNRVGEFQFTFKTIKIPKEVVVEEKPKITLLAIPIDWQDDALSCEAASLKMALAGKEVYVSEYQIMKKIGYDPTVRQGDIWGDPYQKYVGDINGKMCQTGFGVYWEPVAEAARNWQEAEAFSGWSIQDLTSELAQGNPIVVWGTLPVNNLTDCSWFTSEGKFVLAFKETHVRLAVGFVGLADNPSKIIINDPLSGRLYWSTSFFLNNWNAFGRSGVVIR